jgi:phosphoribosyl 1,2-cyclic phosphodiesterase
LPADVLLRELGDVGAAPHLSAILLTHEHDDHAKGAATLARATGAAILANDATIRAAGAGLAAGTVEVFRTGVPFHIGSIEITPFAIPHDAADPVGFALEHNGIRALVACDLGEATDDVLERARGVDLLLIEANYEARLLAVSAYPWFLKNRILGTRGHLSNDAAARAAVGAATDRLRSVYLMHLSEVNNLAPLARDIVRAALDAEGLRTVHVEAVRPNAGGPWWDPAAAGAGLAAS